MKGMKALIAIVTLWIYHKAAEQGFAWAQNDLGNMYNMYAGEGVSQDKREAAKWYRKAAEQGFAKAQFNLGLLYHDFRARVARKPARRLLDGGIGEDVSQDYREAAKWYHLAAEQGLAEAQFNLGWMYDNGEGVAQDIREAAKWYHLAAEQGVAPAQRNLGAMYYKGEGVAQDKRAAAKWYRLAAEQGDAEAQFNLGWMYDNGEEVIQDWKEAYIWFSLAAIEGDENAMKGRDSMAEKLTTADIRAAQEEAKRRSQAIDKAKAAEAAKFGNIRGELPRLARPNGA